jgi:hypothetical protein
MITITTLTDILTYLDNNRSDLTAHADRKALAEALRAADHPAWGSDWAEWLRSNEVEGILMGVVDATT